MHVSTFLALAWAMTASGEEDFVTNFLQYTTGNEAWPPAGGFRYDDPRFGTLTGEEEPVKHLKRWPRQPGEIDTQYEFFYNTVRNGVRKMDSVPVSVSDFPDWRKDLGTIISKHCKSEFFVLVHGFSDFALSPNTIGIRDAVLKHHDSTDCVLVLNWGYDSITASVGPNLDPVTGFFQSVADTITVGRQTALLLYQLIEAKHIHENQVHMIGHSLGTNVLHHTAVRLKEIQLNRTAAFQKVKRITALDPAAFGTRGYPTACIQKTDAAFVDVIHTTSAFKSVQDPRLMMRDILQKGRGLFFDIVFALNTLPQVALQKVGNSIPLGHVDYYVNGASQFQPGCKDCFPKVFLTNDADLVSLFLCCHGTAVKYYIDSLTIDRETLISRPCLPELDPSQPCPGAQPSALGQSAFNYLGKHADPNLAHGKLFVSHATRLNVCDGYD